MGRVIKGARFREERYALEVPEIVVPPIELPGAVDFARGIPSFSETRAYVARVQAELHSTTN